MVPHTQVPPENEEMENEERTMNEYDNDETADNVPDHALTTITGLRSEGHASAIGSGHHRKQYSKLASDKLSSARKHLADNVGSLEDPVSIGGTSSAEKKTSGVRWKRKKLEAYENLGWARAVADAVRFKGVLFSCLVPELDNLPDSCPEIMMQSLFNKLE
ncbi:hypothetical protein EV426DRAFT_705704 [Tirmania nivea]|nr:hypothetical protein EV426DRAFT_705704 [Tirmania nivea]